MTRVLTSDEKQEFRVARGLFGCTAGAARGAHICVVDWGVPLCHLTESHEIFRFL